MTPDLGAVHRDLGDWFGDAGPSRLWCRQRWTVLRHEVPDGVAVVEAWLYVRLRDEWEDGL